MTTNLRKFIVNFPKIIVQILIFPKVYQNYEWLLLVLTIKNIKVFLNFSWSQRWEMLSDCLALSLHLSVSCHFELLIGTAKPGFLFAQRYTNFAWAWGKGDNPTGSELTKNRLLLHYSSRTYFKFNPKT